MSLDGAYRLAIPIFATQIKDGKPCTINNDGNAVSIHQHYGSHNATVTLDGTSPTSLSLIQTGGPSKSYNLIQNCLTIGGCSVSVTQN